MHCLASTADRHPGTSSDLFKIRTIRLRSDHEMSFRPGDTYGDYPTARTNPQRDASSSRHAKATGLPDCHPWRWFAHCGDFEHHGGRGQARCGKRSGRSLCWPSGRAGRKPQRPSRKHSRQQDVRSYRVDVSIRPATRHIRHLKPRTSRALRGEQVIPSAFRTHHPCRGEELLHVDRPGLPLGPPQKMQVAVGLPTPQG
jgi:hypothetical protein